MWSPMPLSRAGPTASRLNLGSAAPMFNLAELVKRPRAYSLGNFASLDLGICLRKSSGSFAEICGDCNFPLSNDQQVLRRFAETMNPRKSCAAKYQNPGSQNSITQPAAKIRGPAKGLNPSRHFGSSANSECLSQITHLLAGRANYINMLS